MRISLGFVDSTKILTSYLKARLFPVHEEKTFEDWVHKYFGTGLAKHFFIPYNTKLYGESLSNLTPEWCERYVPKPNLEETIDGVLKICTK